MIEGAQNTYPKEGVDDYENVEFNPIELANYYRIESVIEREKKDLYGCVRGYDDIDRELLGAK